jgi:hypothetical protein
MNTLLISESNSNINNDQSKKMFETFIKYQNYYTKNELDDINIYILK